MLVDFQSTTECLKLPDFQCPQIPDITIRGKKKTKQKKPALCNVLNMHQFSHNYKGFFITMLMHSHNVLMKYTVKSAKLLPLTRCSPKTLEISPEKSYSPFLSMHIVLIWIIVKAIEINIADFEKVVLPFPVNTQYMSKAVILHHNF